MAAIDIIVPVFNQSEVLSLCLQSIFNQTFQDFTITIVDDGSTDNIELAITPWRRQVRLVRQENLGAAAARNRGAREGKAPLLLFCDADTTLNQPFLTTHTQTLNPKNHASYSYSSFKWGFKTFRPGPFNAHRLRREPFINTHALIRRDHFPGFDEKLRRFQDWDLWLTMLEHGHVGEWIPEVLFTVRPGGTMSTWLPKAAYRYLPWLPAVKNYQQAMRVIRLKHQLSM